MPQPARTIDITQLPRQLFINGEWVDGLDGARISVRDPFDDSEILSIAEARILTGGGVPDDAALAKGCFIRPTVVEAKPGDTVFEQEVFGPFVSVTRFKDEAHAIALANASDYGLGSGLWTTNLSRAHRVADAIRAGMVWVNCYKRVHPGSPFGGVGQSGYGRDLGSECMHEYTEAKSVWINYDAQIPPFYKR